MDDGRISRQTAGAERAMAVSTAPIVAGNRPANAEADEYETVAFVGQTPVKVRGPVDAGDYVVPSGHNDGVGVAVTPESITSDQAALVVGRALEAAGGPGVTSVNVLVGLPQEQMGQTALARRDGRIAQLEAQVERLSEANAELAARMDALEEKVNAQGGADGVSLPNLLLGGLLLVGALVWRRSGGEGVWS